jgi:hypothetical protein
MIEPLDYAEIAQELQLLAGQEQILPFRHAILLNAESKGSIWRQRKTWQFQAAFGGF